MTTDRISLTGIAGFGFHGVLDHEGRVGQRFTVDVTLGVDLRAAGSSDALEDTVDYGAIAARVAERIVGPPFALIEALADRIATDCLRHERVDVVEVTVHKPNAPVPTLVDDVSVTVRRVRDDG